MRFRTKLRVVAFVLASLVPALAVPTALADSAALELTASTTLTTFGDAVTLSGLASGDPSCSNGRAVELQWHAADGSAFAAIAEGTTGADGSFAFEQSPSYTGSFRAVLPEDGTCLGTVSDELSVGVRALVDASVVSGSSQAGSCVEVFVEVSPPKPGQTVELQHRADGTWTTIETLALNGDGQGRADPCLGWEDIGVARLRARWTSQDPLNATGTSVVLALQVVEAPWMLRIDDAVGGRAVSVSVADEGTALYRHADETPRTPASNEKLLLAMALLDTFGPDRVIPTRAAARSFDGGVVGGDLWILGRGDPLLGRSSLGDLAGALVDAGLRRVTGSVLGSTAFFQRDWDAPGWDDAAREDVNRPTALAFEGNRGADPELAAAANLTKQLEKRGVRVGGEPGTGVPPGGLEDLASIDSKPLRVLLATVLRPSWNFGAEMLGKGLGAEVEGPPGTIAKGAAAIQAWVRAHGVDATLYDDSGLSYANRVTAAGIVDLLGQAEAEDWGLALRRALPTGGQGTLEDRLHGVQLRAKTGTLTDISALSGWVYAERSDSWVEFSILSDVAKPAASHIEDRIVRILEHDAG